MSKQAKSVVPRKCGSCLYYSMWTGTCCRHFDFIEKQFEDKACKDWERSEDYDYNPDTDSASYDPEDEN